MSELFQIKENLNDKVILSVKELTPIEVAKNPELSSDMRYITITKGRIQTLTVVDYLGRTKSFIGKKDGKYPKDINIFDLRLFEKSKKYLLTQNVLLGNTTLFPPHTAVVSNESGKYFILFSHILGEYDSVSMQTIGEVNDLLERFSLKYNEELSKKQKDSSSVYTLNKK